MYQLNSCIVITALALLSGCASRPQAPINGLYGLQSLTNSNIEIDSTATLKLNEGYLLLAGSNNTFSASVDKNNTVGTFTLIRNSGTPPNQFARILLNSLVGSTLASTENGNLIFIKNEMTAATFAPIPMPEGVEASSTGQ
jgi:hypothetical protein